jgi:hypothetical protein
MNDQITKIATLNWNIKRASRPLGITEAILLGMTTDGRTANSLVAAWLASNGFDRVPDGKSGWLLIRENRTYRLRVGTDKLSLSPSVTRGAGRRYTTRKMAKEMKALDGFLIVFSVDMPNADVWAVEESYAWTLRDAGLLNTKWTGDSLQIRSHMLKTAN